MKVAVTGGTGFVGRFIVEDLSRAGHDVTMLSRRPPAAGFFERDVPHRAYDLGGPPPPLEGFEALVHAAFDHVPGRYRGGEGDDPPGFLRRNLDGSVALFEAARRAGVARVVFLSSRAVYGAYPPGTPLDEAMAPRPDTLYGRAKHEAEQALGALGAPFGPSGGPGPFGISLRATGVYGPAGPGRRHKWSDLFDRFRRGEPIAPRAGTEVHGADLAAAVRLLLAPGAPGSGEGGVFNVSDLVLDRRVLLAEVAALTGWRGPLPAVCEVPVSVMETERLRGLGWRPGGLGRLRAALPGMIEG